jgi:hypothetical protein
MTYLRTTYTDGTPMTERDARDRTVLAYAGLAAVFIVLVGIGALIGLFIVDVM